VSERALEIKVGAFVLVALGLLVALVVILGNVSLGSGYTVHVRYGYSGAIHEGAPVKVSGVSVGRVSEVDFLGGGVRDAEGRPLLVSLTLSLQPRARPVVRTGTRFVIGTQGVLGEPYVELVPGDLTGAELADGATVRGVDAPRTDLLMSRLTNFLNDLGDVMGDNKDVLRDLLRSGGGLAKNLDEVLQENRTQIHQGLVNVLAATSDLKRLSADAAVQLGRGGDLHGLIADARVAAGVLRRQLPPLLQKAQTVGDALVKLSRVSGELTPDDAKRLKAALAHYEKVGERLDKVSADLETLLTRVDRGQGTVGALLQDDQIYEDLKELVRDLKAHPWKVLWKE
jgi:phospholipid/cholesterol/gamma-HCH transport system substrate-binding protein